MTAVAQTFLVRFSISPPWRQSQVSNKYVLLSPAGPVLLWLFSLAASLLSVSGGWMYEAGGCRRSSVVSG